MTLAKMFGYAIFLGETLKVLKDHNIWVNIYHERCINICMCLWLCMLLLMYVYVYTGLLKSNFELITQPFWGKPKIYILTIINKAIVNVSGLNP